MAILDIPITHVMTKKITSVQPSQKLIDVKHIFEKKDFHHHIPVIERGELKGMISLVDFLFSIKGATLDDDENVYHHLTVKDIMRSVTIRK
ncbi:MAG: inosine 5-monophosphate dehydrogenase [Bacteroidetes bacterium]|nr:inosine 5-monophosphate dehydrogenase [Bacteroidota bacterium]